MTIQELAAEIARGLIETGVEGGFDCVTCSTAGDYPSIGCSQWEGGRANALLEKIPGGERYAYRPYSNLVEEDELGDLAELLGSEEGQNAQNETLAEDCETYVEWLLDIIKPENVRCLIYAGMWCPTSHAMVCRFLERRAEEPDLASLYDLYILFREQYADYALCSEYAEGYENRARATYEYVAALDLSQYGVPSHGDD